MITLIILLLMFAAPVYGIYAIRRRTRREIDNDEDISWSKFEEEHGEAEAKLGIQ